MNFSFIIPIEDLLPFMVFYKNLRDMENYKLFSVSKFIPNIIYDPFIFMILNLIYISFQ